MRTAVKATKRWGAFRAPSQARCAREFVRALRSALLVFLHLDVGLHRLHAFGVPRDLDGLVDFVLRIRGAGHPDNAILVGVDLDVLEAAEVLRCELRLDL